MQLHPRNLQGYYYMAPPRNMICLEPFGFNLLFGFNLPFEPFGFNMICRLNVSEVLQGRIRSPKPDLITCKEIRMASKHIWTLKKSGPMYLRKQKLGDTQTHADEQALKEMCFGGYDAEDS